MFRQKKSLIERFWPNVEIPVGDGCWIWKPVKGKQGRYGSFTHGRVRYRAHRLAYELTYGPIPRGQIVMHLCDNPNCVRPSHLRAGTQKDNLYDAAMKNRMGARNPLKGSAHGMAKLTERDVLELRRLCAAGRHSQQQLAEMFGVKRVTVQKIVYGKIWAHLPGSFRRTASPSRKGPKSMGRLYPPPSPSWVGGHESPYRHRKDDDARGWWGR